MHPASTQILISYRRFVRVEVAVWLAANGQAQIDWLVDRFARIGHGSTKAWFTAVIKHHSLHIALRWMVARGWWKPDQLRWWASPAHEQTSVQYQVARYSTEMVRYGERERTITGAASDAAGNCTLPAWESVRCAKSRACRGHTIKADQQ